MQRFSPNGSITTTTINNNEDLAMARVDPTLGIIVAQRSTAATTATAAPSLLYLSRDVYLMMCIQVFSSRVK